MRTDIRKKLEEIAEAETPATEQIMTLYRMFEIAEDEDVISETNRVYDAIGNIFTLDEIKKYDGCILTDELISYMTISPCVEEAEYTSQHIIDTDTEEYRFVTVELTLTDGSRVSLGYCLYLGEPELADNNIKENENEEE